MSGHLAKRRRPTMRRTSQLYFQALCAAAQISMAILADDTLRGSNPYQCFSPCQCFRNGEITSRGRLAAHCGRLKARSSGRSGGLCEAFVVSIKNARATFADDLIRRRRCAARSVDGRKLWMFGLRLTAGEDVAEGDRADTLFALALVSRRSRTSCDAAFGAGHFKLCGFFSRTFCCRCGGFLGVGNSSAQRHGNEGDLQRFHFLILNKW